MKWLLLLALSSVAGADASVPPTDVVACRTVDDCWLDGGTPIKRPKRLRGKPFPRGDCGLHHNWLSNRLYCEDNVCKVLHVGDRCEIPSGSSVAWADQLVDFGEPSDGARSGVRAQAPAR